MGQTETQGLNELLVSTLPLHYLKLIMQLLYSRDREASMTSKILWKPTEKRIKESNMLHFIEYVNKRYGMGLKNYFELYSWSISDAINFWEAIWDYVNIIASKRFDKVVDDLNKFPGARWFIGAKLNFAENLLRFRDNRPAIIFVREDSQYTSLTYRELFERVTALASSLREMGLRAGDRVVAYMPNIPETIVAMLASTSLGCIWSSCGTELGAGAVIDRFGQISPRILFTVDGYMYKGVVHDLRPNVERVTKSIESLEGTVMVPYITSSPKNDGLQKALAYQELIKGGEGGEFSFEQFPSDHPLYIMFSSGTTGKPKCMVQPVAGVLINHLKELILHTDLRREDRITYITTPSWMMWNWLASSLAVGATVVLYDGNPNYPDWTKMWRIIQDFHITIFGCSASYINYLKNIGATPGRWFDLSSLREISQTGSPLSEHGFEWVYSQIKRELHFNSISGGTDINGCFVAGSPTLPVYAGQIQAPALGMNVKAYDEEGNPIYDRPGELICETPTPSMPLYFWGDTDNQRYWDAYFSYYEPRGKRVWRHGDYVQFHTDTGGVTIFGRSDATLKPSGVRIGTAEIYRALEKIPQIEDSLAVGKAGPHGEEIILFVKLSGENKLTEELKENIRKALREEASPRHVPQKILEAPDIPYTFNMKKVEIAVRNILEGKPVTNREALINPESLEYFKEIRHRL